MLANSASSKEKAKVGGSHETASQANEAGLPSRRNGNAAGNRDAPAVEKGNDNPMYDKSDAPAFDTSEIFKVLEKKADVSERVAVTGLLCCGTAPQHGTGRAWANR